MIPLNVMCVFGTRPEAIKMAPVIAELGKSPLVKASVAVTAQHREMLDGVLRHFNIVPDYDLDIMRPSQSLTEVSVRAIAGLSEVYEASSPDVVLVHGDTATTFCASLAAYYHKIKVGHVEAGLRTGDKYAPFPEEVMRRLCDSISDMHFAPTQQAKLNLLAEGIPETSIYVTGNTAIDALLMTVKEEYEFSDLRLREMNQRGEFRTKRIVLVEVHRRENFGEPMDKVFSALAKLERAMPDDALMMISLHKNPEVRGPALRHLHESSRLIIFEPVDYPDWANLMARSYFLISDSGGVQEEAPAIGKPVLLTREKTERPEAVQANTVKLVGTDPAQIFGAAMRLFDDPELYHSMSHAANPYGDGKAAVRTVAGLLHSLGLGPKPPDFR
ncbi:MAG TPA: UDP-N-acetylglucosamine 2-epimerase (non-hydrolyzing) [Firmicutes bacterium]|nr:UDP-N-acetylglucosamine 2-epimerase (non-hydrolyzing) [Bacillota bacterium]